MTRLFISYRSADGKKEAHRLAEDLGRLDGVEQLFHDTQDLTVGTSPSGPPGAPPCRPPWQPRPPST